MKILVAYAVPEELAGFSFPPGVDHLATGIGPIEATLQLSAKLATLHYELVINVGIGGGFEGIAVGSQVVVAEEHFVDLGREDRSSMALPKPYTLVDHVEADTDFLEDYLPEFIRKGRRLGNAITSATVTTSDPRASALRKLVPTACVESMEGFAVLRCAAHYGVPALELRGISNRVGDRARAQWDLRAGAQAAAALLKDCLHELADLE